MANDRLKVTLVFKWWYHPVYFLMKICAVLGWEFSEQAVERFVEKSTRLELR